MGLSILYFTVFYTAKTPTGFKPSANSEFAVVETVRHARKLMTQLPSPRPDSDLPGMV